MGVAAPASRSPSQCPGTARSSASGGRLRIETASFPPRYCWQPTARRRPPARRMPPWSSARRPARGCTWYTSGPGTSAVPRRDPTWAGHPYPEFEEDLEREARGVLDGRKKAQCIATRDPYGGSARCRACASRRPSPGHPPRARCGDAPTSTIPQPRSASDRCYADPLPIETGRQREGQPRQRRAEYGRKHRAEESVQHRLVLCLRSFYI